MIVSVEMRWFWATACPDQFDAWFRSGSPSPGVGCREDEYVYEQGQTELGIKRRGEKPGVEIKGLVAVVSESRVPAPFVGAAEIWCKWPSSALTLRDLPTVKTKKQRWLRKFDMTRAEPMEIPMAEDEAPADHRPLPPQGCNVELTRNRTRAETSLVDVRIRGVWRIVFNRTEPARRAFGHGGSPPAPISARGSAELPGLAGQARSAPAIAPRARLLAPDKGKGSFFGILFTIFRIMLFCVVFR